MLLLTPLANVGASESGARQASKQQTNARVVYDERAAATAAAVKRCKAGASLV